MDPETYISVGGVNDLSSFSNTNTLGRDQKPSFAGLLISGSGESDCRIYDPRVCSDAIAGATLPNLICNPSSLRLP